MRFPGRSAAAGSGVTQPQHKTDVRIGEILSDSNSELSSIDGDDVVESAAATTSAPTAKRVNAQPVRSRARSSFASSDADSDRPARVSSSSNAPRSSGNDSARQSQRESSSAKIRQLPDRASPTPSVGSRSQQSHSQSMRSSRATRKAASRKWYSDSDNDSDAAARSSGGDAIDSDARGSTQPALESVRANRTAKAKAKIKAKPSSSSRNDSSDEDSDAKADTKPQRSGAVDSTDSDDIDAVAETAGAKRHTKLKTLGAPSRNDVLSPTAETNTNTSRGDAVAKRKTNFQKLVAKTFSPFNSRRKDIESPTADTSSRGLTAAAKTERNSVQSPQSDVAATQSTAPAARRTVTSTTSASSRRQTTAPNDNASPNSLDSSSPMTHATSEPALLNRRTNRLKQQTSPSASELLSSHGSSSSAAALRPLDSPHEAAARRALEAAAAASTAAAAAANSTTTDTLSTSPGAMRRFAGASLGPPGSGVLLEGWLRQKQRRGVKGLKKWNARYFVLYARSNELRYYADVVRSAWGAVPLGEIGSIALRLIQKIGKPSHPKYRGCRFDITCRNSWGTHYADDYVSSDDDTHDASGSSNHPSGGAAAAVATVLGSTDPPAETTGTGTGTGTGPANKTERTATPRSSRMYSLVTDSPQTTVAWMTALDSLLVRSANSPRPDGSTAATTAAPGSGSGAKSKRTTAAGAATTGSRATGRRRTSALESETLVLVGAGDRVPTPVAIAIKYIFDSTPGIETERFYDREPDAAKLKTGLKFLNQFAADATRKPTLDELDAVLDPVTAGAVVKRWLAQRAQPLVPFEMFDDFQVLATTAQTAPFTLLRDLKALIDALPRRNFAMLVCVLVHLNDVHGYASKNQMDAAALAALFAEFVLRRQRSVATDTCLDTGDATERALSRALVQEMIANVDAIIDERAVDEFAAMH